MISVEEAINNFYKEKSKYESLLEKDKKSIIKNKELSWKEKRLEYKKLKPKCVNCKRPVGSIFTITHDSSKLNEFRILRATCGDRVNPCNFNININPGSYNNIVTDLKKEEDDLKKYKMKIIDEKNKLLFGYISTEDAVTNFEEIKNDITTSSELLGLYYKEYNNVFDNEEKKSMLKQLLSSSYLLINQIKNAIKNYEKTHNTQYCQDAVTMYIEQLKPILDKIMNLKYSASFVDYDIKNGVYSLIQQKYTIRNIESMNVEPQVINFEKGVAVVPQNKTKKARDEPSVKKNVTKKRQLLIEEDSDLDEIEQQSQAALEEEKTEVNSPLYEPVSPPYNPASPPYNPASPVDDNQQSDDEEE
uniref:Uncharacterized protein n=1 Tax=viral metagenome TaxID=1070528 RepID=A0A6C0IGI1_9ZZZZ